MKCIPTLAFSAALLAALPTLAAAATLDFEGVTSFASVADFYNGGTDGAGVGGVDLGVSFSGAALALANDALGPYFSHAPTPGTVMFASDSTAVMTVAKGFSGELSFWYSAATPAFDVATIYAGADGTGAVLGAVSLSQNAQLGGCSDSAFCNWQRISLSFGGTAHSVSFGGNAGNVAFDDVTVSAVPESGSALMMMLGGAGLLLARLHRRDRSLARP